MKGKPTSVLPLPPFAPLILPPYLYPSSFILHP